MIIHRTLWSDLAIGYSPPERVHADQGSSSSQREGR
jgi:hypothetical protein